MTVEQVRTPETIAALRGQRADLLAALQHYERALAAPAGERVADWLAVVHDALVELGAAFEHHIAITEQPDGLFDECVRSSPRTSNRVDALRSEHEKIRRSIADDLADVRRRARAMDADTAASVRDGALELLSTLSRHRQAGADLVYEAFTVDIGGSE